ncbi:MAG: hypothetical protein ACRERC_17035 [Candidatus Binatia bacterium]
MSETWGRFFPMTKDPTTHLYPPPGTVEFAAAYAEPVVEFLAAAATLRDALMAAATPTAAAADLTLLNRLHDNVVRHVVRGGNGAAELAWAAPSLLSAFAVMLVEDLVAGGTLHRCAECEAPFLSSAYQARFCTPTCRQTSAMRAYRQRGSTAAAPNKRLKIGDASRTRPAAKE